MKKLKSALIIAVTILSLSTQSFAFCSDGQLQACKEVVDAGSKVIRLQQEQIIDLQSLTSIQQNQIDTFKIQIEQVTPSWYERPEFVAPFSFLAGFLLMKSIGK